MARLQNILLYAGGDLDPTLTLERATALASDNGAKLTLVDVLPEADLRPGWATARRQELEALARPIRRRQVDVVTRVLVGKPATELIHQVHRGGHDLVMKTAQGLGGFLGGIFGSTALDLLRQCPCPVWVVKPEDVPGGRAIAAVDPDREDPANDALSRRVLELAASLSASRGLELDIVHAWWWSEPTPHDGFPTMAAESAAEVTEETRETIAKAMQTLVETVDLSGVTYRLHISQGMPFDVISAFGERAELAVLGTQARTGLAGMLLGNTVERTLRRLDCSVLAVKPDDFVSPIQLPTESLPRCA